MLDLTQQRILLTGGAGFLGSHVAERLNALGCTGVFIPRACSFDLTKNDDIKCLLDHQQPNVIIHLAALCGGIGMNRARPGELFYQNLMMGVQLMEQARLYGVQKFISVGTVCAYPKHTPSPFREDDLWSGYPEETNAAYGLAKKMLLVQGDAYRSQYGFNSIYLLPVNLYGPRDNFRADSSHVIPALIKKIIEAQTKGLSEVVVWGTGTATREFLYVNDAARAIVLAAQYYDQPYPVNIGSGQEISIHLLVELISDLIGYRGSIVWDSSKPDGQPKRSLDISRAKAFGFQAETTLVDGLKETIQWYQNTLTLA